MTRLFSLQPPADFTRRAAKAANLAQSITAFDWRIVVASLVCEIEPYSWVHMSLTLHCALRSLENLWHLYTVLVFSNSVLNIVAFLSERKLISAVCFTHFFSWNAAVDFWIFLLQ